MLTGLTKISRIVSSCVKDGEKVPCDGELPSEDEEKKFREVIGTCRTLPTNFTRDVIMKAPSEDIMNSMTRSILTLAAYDKKAKDISVSNSLRQCIQLISEFPLLAVYAYHAYNHYEKNQSMYIHNPDPKLSTAVNLLMMLRHDRKYTPVEAKVLDLGIPRELYTAIFAVARVVGWSAHRMEETFSEKRRSCCDHRTVRMRKEQKNF